MNITELARKLKVPTKELREKLPELGFDIGMKAIKVDDRIAQKVIEIWPQKIMELRRTEAIKKEEETKEESEKVTEKTISLPPFITVHDFAEKLNLPVTKVISELLKNGVTASINERIDYEIAAIVAEDLGFKTVLQQVPTIEEKKKTREAVEELIERKNQSKLILRPPIVVIMGHVDHGKTALLDAIRKTNIMAEEAGGITQHIGAYQIKIETKEGKGPLREITFIDTPGHEAFKAMRTRGGEVADIAVLVVAADDGIQPQTIESIKIIQEEKLPFLVAINKIDKTEADIDKIKKELAEINLTPEDWGGKTICVPVSAKTKQGLDNLLEMILLLADLEKDRLFSNPKQEAVGTVIEAHLDKGEGPVATVLIQSGTLKPKDLVVVGGLYGGVEGRIKILKNFQGKIVEEAGPGMPVKILGLKKVPKVGDILQGIKNLKELKKRIKEKRIKKESVSQIPAETTGAGSEKKKSLNIILRTDVLGSQEAIIEALKKIKHPEVEINIIKKGLGNILETDILQAETAGKEEETRIIGFQVKASSQIDRLAKEKKVKLKIYKVIYDLIEDIKKALESLLEPERLRIDLAFLEVIALFRKKPDWQIIGAKVKQGRVLKGAYLEIWRKNRIVGKGKVSQLQIARKDVEEAKEGVEVGLKIEGKELDIQIGDNIKIYKEEEKRRQI